MILYNSRRLFFITPAAEKTKTQGKNSSQKLKEKTQLQGGFYLQFRKLKKKTKISSKNSNFLKGWYCLCDFYQQNFSKSEIFWKFCEHFFQNLKEYFKKFKKKPKSFG